MFPPAYSTRHFRGFALIACAWLIQTDLSAAEQSSREETSTTATGMIRRPSAGDSVLPRFTVSGELPQIADGYHAWLVVEVGKLLWPKEPALSEVSSPGGKFEVGITEGGQPNGGRFALSLWVLPHEGEKFVMDWLHTGRQIGKYPGLKEIPGGTRLQTVENLRLATGRILSPKTGDSVRAAMDVEVELLNLPKGHHAWVCTEINGLIWPKEPEVRATNGKWRASIVESGKAPDYKLSLRLIAVPGETHMKLEEWIKRAHKTGNWPGLKMHRDIPGAVELDEAHDLSLKNR